MSCISGGCEVGSSPTKAVVKSGAFKHECNVDHLIIRHGTDRAAILQSVGISGEEAARILKATPSEMLRDTAVPLWPAGWWGKNTGVGRHRGGREQIEFVPPPTQAIATTFASTLSDVLRLLQRGNRIEFSWLDRLKAKAGCRTTASSGGALCGLPP